jgi:predicted RNA-binding Zn-ribbon protein involved in translation (DUF1610 family)
MVKITCTGCGKQLSIDETKLPMKEVKFPCPQCKADQFFDRSKMGAEPEAAPAPASPAVVAESGDDFGLPQALLVGKEVPGIRDVVRSMGMNLNVFPEAAAGRDFYYREYPHLVNLSPNKMTPPPLEEMGAILSVSPIDRRKGFFVLVADNLRTLDGNAAFLYNVSLVVATKDVPQFTKIYSEAHRFHENLYKNFSLLSGQ